MRNFLVVACVAVSVLFFGCGGGKCGKDSKKVALASTAMSQEIPLYEESDFLVEGDASNFAFLDDGVEEVVGQKEERMLANAKEMAEYDEWLDEEEAPLAWNEEENDFKFEVVNFDLNREAIRKDQKTAMTENIEVAKEAVKNGKEIVVVGHCCQLGAASYNMSLSEKRAKTIRDEMVENGVPEGKVKIVGVGHECPIVWSNAEDRRQMIDELAPNRRAEISIG